MNKFINRFFIIYIILSLVFQYAQSQTDTVRALKLVHKPNIFSDKTIKAIIIGVSDYKFITDLEYADDDANLFYKFLVSLPGVNTDNILLFTDTTANSQNIITRFYKMFTENAGPDDLIFFYFAGHGDVDFNMDAAYLLLNRVPDNSDYEISDAIRIGTIQRYVSQAVKKGATVFIATDACRSGTIVGDEQGVKSTLAALNQQWDNTIKICSCEPHQYSQEGKKWGNGHGVFTYYLVNGLKGVCDNDNDGVINFFELREYVRDNVHNDTKNQQSPCFFGSSNTNLVAVDEDFKKLADSSSNNKTYNYVEKYEYVTNRGISKNKTVSFQTQLLVNNFNDLIHSKKLIKPSNYKKRNVPKQTNLTITNRHAAKIFNNNASIVKFSPNGEHIVTGGDENEIKVVSTKDLILEKTINQKGVYSLDFSADGKYLAGGSLSNNVTVWAYNRDTPPIALSGPSDDVRSVQFSPSSDYIAAGGNDESIWIWETKKWTLHKSFLKQHSNTITSLCFISDESLISASTDGTLLFWDLKTGELLYKIENSVSISALKSFDNRRKLVFADSKGKVEVWDLSTFQKINEFNLNVSNINTIEVDEQGDFIFVGGEDKIITTINRKKETISKIPIKWGVKSLNFNPSYSHLVGACYGGDIFTCNVNFPINQPINEEYAYDYYLELIDRYEVSDIKDDLTASLAAALLFSIQQTLTPFVNGAPVLPEKDQIDEALQETEILLDLYKKDEILVKKVESLKLLLEVFLISLNNDFENLPVAVEKVDTIINSEPWAAYTYNTQALLLQKLHEMEEAEEAANIAATRIPKWTEPKSTLGKIHFMNHKYSEALREFNNIIEQRPDLSIGYLHMANVFRFLNGYTTANELYSKALEADSLNPLIYSNYARLFIKQKKFKSAEELLVKGFEIKNDYADLHLASGELFTEKLYSSPSIENYLLAQEEYDKTIKLDQNIVDPYLGKIRLYYFAFFNPQIKFYLSKNNWNEFDLLNSIMDNCEIVKHINPYCYEAYYWNSVQLYLKQKDQADRINKYMPDYIKAMVEVNPKDPEPYYYSALLCLLDEDFENTEYYLQLAIGKDHQHTPSYILLHKLYLAQNNRKERKELMNTIEKSFPEPDKILIE